MWPNVANGCDLLALVAALGALVQATWLLALAPAATQVRRRADGYFCITLIFLTLTTATALLARSADVSGVSLWHLAPIIAQVLGQTHFGHVWWLLPDPGPRWTVLKLDAEGIATWQRLQPKLAHFKATYRGFAFSAKFSHLGMPPTGTDAYIMSVWLQLGPDQAPLELIDRARVKVKKS